MNVRTTFEQSLGKSGALRRQTTPAKAVGGFLKAMKTVAEKTFAQWQETLVEGIEECPLSYDARRSLLEVHPLDDYYLSGVVALEAAKIRQYFPTTETDELLGQIGEQVDAFAGRSDRIVSDMVFSLIGRIESTATPDSQKKPYDQVVKAILQRMGIDRIEATSHLLGHPLYRHSLGEPLALNVPHWWSRFCEKYALVPTAMSQAAPLPQQAAAAPPSTHRRVPRRAPLF